MIASIVIGRGTKRQQFDVPRNRKDRYIVARILKDALFGKGKGR